MIYLESLLLTGMLICGLMTTWKDFQSGIIPNRILLCGFIFGVIIHVCLLIFSSAAYYPTWFLNMIIADALAFILYYAKMWAAGDAKLFMLLFFLVPPRLLDYGELTYCIVPYICIFVPALLWICGDSIIRGLRHEKMKKKHISLRQLGSNAIIILVETTSIYSLALLISDQFVLENGLFMSGLLMLYAFLCSSFPFTKKWPIIVGHVVILLISWIVGRYTFSFPDWKNMLFLLGVFGFQYLVSMHNYQCIDTESIQRGMVLSADTVLSFMTSKVQGLPFDFSEELTAKITDDQAKAVRRWGKTPNGNKEVWIVRKIPFAVMIFLGFIIWMTIRIAR